MQKDVKFANRERVVLVFTKIGLRFCDELAVFKLPSILKSITLPDCTTGVFITFLAQADMKINEAVQDNYDRQIAVPACTRFVRGAFCNAVKQLLWGERIHTANTAFAALARW